MFNKKLLTTAVCTAALLGGTYSATSIAATASGNATAIVVSPLTVAESLAMDFGTVLSGATGGTVEINATLGTVVLGGDATQTGAFNAATFDIVGTAGLTYLVTTSVSGTLSDGANLMLINNFNNNAIGTIPVGGTETFSVGGILNVNSGQNSGTYNTTNLGGIPYTVTVNYN